MAAFVLMGPLVGWAGVGALVAGADTAGADVMDAEVTGALLVGGLPMGGEPVRPGAEPDVDGLLARGGPIGGALLDAGGPDDRLGDEAPPEETEVPPAAGGEDEPLEAGGEDAVPPAEGVADDALPVPGVVPLADGGVDVPPPTPPVVPLSPPVATTTSSMSLSVASNSLVASAWKTIAAVPAGCTPCSACRST